MQFIKSSDGHEGVEAMAKLLISSLHENINVLWLICGGSNIPLAAEAMKQLQKSLPVEELEMLTVGQTDERYGPVGHKDSNWQQMIEAGFDFNNVQAMPILMGKDLEGTVEDYARRFEEIFPETDLIIAQFGIGADGHVAGMLPHTPGIHAPQLVFGYEAAPFVRVTLTPKAFEKIDTAFTFVFGESKRVATENLQTKELALEDEPCQILKTIPQSYFYSDQL